MKKASECKLIRFIDPHYNDLFYLLDGDLLDGDLLDITHKDGKKRQVKCQYIDETRIKVGREDYHICQLAELLERNGSTAKPAHPLSDITLESLNLHQKNMMANRKALRNAFWSWRFIIRDEWDGEKDVPRVSMKWEDNHAEKASVMHLRESVQIANRLRAGLLTSLQKVKEMCADRAADETIPGESLYDFVVSSHTLVHYIRIHIDKQVIATVYCCQRTEMDMRYDLVSHHAKDLMTDKFTVDFANGYVDNVYYNPDSNAGGELVRNRLSFTEIVNIANKTSSEETFWDCFDSEARQTYTSITDKDFRAVILSFVNDPADYRWRDTTTTMALIALARAHAKTN